MQEKEQESEIEEEKTIDAFTTWHDWNSNHRGFSEKLQPFPTKIWRV